MHGLTRAGKFLYGALPRGWPPKLALELFAQYTPDLGICQWFHFEGYRLDNAVQWLRHRCAAGPGRHTRVIAFPVAPALTVSR